MKKIKLPLVIFSIIIVNALGFLIKYFGYNAFIILLGFRFHISLVIPFLFFLPFIELSFYKRTFKKNPLSNLGFVFAVILISIIITSLLCIFFLKKINFPPDYFYEFGISSIIDFPVYLVWNLPQLLLFGLFITLLHESKFNYFSIMIIIPFFFAFELFFLKNLELVVITAISLIIISFLFVWMFKLNNNVYSAVIFCFSVIWASLLVFGSGSKLLINNFFAAQYSSWDGFINLPNFPGTFVVPFNLFITMIIFILLRMRVQRNKLSQNQETL